MIERFKEELGADSKVVATGGYAEFMSKDHQLTPIIVRFLGTNMEEGKRILQESGLNVHPISDLTEGIAVLKGLGTA